MKKGKIAVWAVAVATSATLSAVAKTITINAVEQVGAITFSPAAGAIDKGDVITITCATDGADIQCKLGNGEWTAYTAPVAINAATTLYAKASKTGMTDNEDSAAYTIKSYAVNLGTLTNGSITRDKETASKGDFVTLTMVPESGYHYVANSVAITEVNSSDIDEESNTIVFAMPSQDVTVTATFEEDQQALANPAVYTFSEHYSENTTLTDAVIVFAPISMTISKGSASTNPQYYSNGTSLRLYGGSRLLFNSEKYITSITVSFGDGDGSNAITSNVGNYNAGTWTGAAKNISLSVASGSGNRRISSISVTWSDEAPQQYPISIADGIQNGSVAISGDITQAYEGDEVIVVPTAEQGYQLKSLTYKKGSDAAVAITKTGDEYKFVMPNGAILINAEFEPTTNTSNPTTVTKTMSEIVSANNYTVSSGSDVTCYTSFALDSNVTISTSGEANCGSFWGSNPYNAWRLYQNKSGDITIAVSGGKTLQSVTITYSNSNSGTLKSGSTTIASASTQTVSAESVTFSVGNTGSATNGQVRVTQISVTYL